MLFHFEETRYGTSLHLKNLLKIFFAVFAERTFDVVGEEIALIDITAYLAHPAAFAILGLLGDLRFGLDVLLVIVVGY